MARELAIQQPFPIPTGFFLNMDSSIFTQPKKPTMESLMKKSAKKRTKRMSIHNPKGNGTFSSVTELFRSMTLPQSLSLPSPVKIVPVRDETQDMRANSSPELHGTSKKPKKSSKKSEKIKSSRDLQLALVSSDRPTVILTYILEQIAKKERDNDAQIELKLDIFHKLRASPAFSALLPVPVPPLPAKVDDWLDSSVLLEALVDEEDTVHLELAILFRAVCETHKGIAEDVLLDHFFSALRLLFRIHKELNCPVKEHRRFWAAHSVFSSTSLAAILSRLAHLNKCRNYLIDILRLASKTSTFKENGFLNFSHFPLPKRPIRLVHARHGHSTRHGHGSGFSRTHMLSTSSSTVSVAAATLNSPAHNSHEPESSAVKTHENKPASPGTGSQGPSSALHHLSTIRASARKSIQVFRQINGMQTDDSIFQSRGQRRRTNLAEAAAIDSESSAHASELSAIIAALEAGSGLVSSAHEFTNKFSTGATDTPMRNIPTVPLSPVSELPHSSAATSVSGSTPRSTIASSHRLSFGGIAPTRVLNQQRKTSVMGSSHTHKLTLLEENDILKSWVEDWSHTLPWKVKSFVFGAVELLPAALSSAAKHASEAAR